MNSGDAMRHDGRAADQLRPLRIQRGFTRRSPGSVLIQAGGTTILCTADVDEAVPPWKAAQPNPTGWVTAEYSMLPGSTSPRKKRDRMQLDGRTTEIQRLIGRSLRSVVDMAALGPRTVTIDCDVLEADGGTRTLSITGGYIALVDALSSIRAPEFEVRRALTGSVAAVSVGVWRGEVVLDLDYEEDSRADVDFNVVMTGAGEFVEIQGTAEKGTFSDSQLAEMLRIARGGLAGLRAEQQRALGGQWPV
jgi:ribonuclease PH